jgi:hypothetical protein
MLPPFSLVYIFTPILLVDLVLGLFALYLFGLNIPVYCLMILLLLVNFREILCLPNINIDVVLGWGVLVMGVEFIQLVLYLAQETVVDIVCFLLHLLELQKVIVYLFRLQSQLAGNVQIAVLVSPNCDIDMVWVLNVTVVKISHFLLLASWLLLFVLVVKKVVIVLLFLGVCIHQL